MRIIGLSLAAIVFAASSAWAATPLGLATGVFAGQPDSAGKVPTFNGVPGANSFNFDVAAPQAFLTHGKVYTYCVIFQNNNYSGDVQLSYSISRKTGTTHTTIQSQFIGKPISVNGNGFYALCLNGKALADSPGPATLTGAVTFETSPKVVTAVGSQIYLQ